MSVKVDFFCRVVDNYGDAGVAWRWVSEWHRRRPHDALRLFIDDASLIEKLAPKQPYIKVLPWESASEAGDIVIVFFATRLSDITLQSMVNRGTKHWVNIDYLSAEAWIDSHHGLYSPHPQFPLKELFYFPGFTSSSGGLVREQSLTLPLQSNASRGEKIYVFAYPHAPKFPMPVIYAERDIGFVPQAEFDALLAKFDFLVVRGEDSFVRAQYAAKPFIWHIYVQAEDHHLIKLDAFLERYLKCADDALARYVKALSLAWNKNEQASFTHLWQDLPRYYQDWCVHAQAWAVTLFQRVDAHTQLFHRLELRD